VVDRRKLDGRNRRRMSRLARVLPLPLAGRLYYTTVAAAALAAGATAFSRSQPTPTGWLTFVVLAASAAPAQGFFGRTGRSQGFHTAIVFVTAGALLLPPELIVLMVVIQHVPEWFKERYPAYIQTFNIYNFALAALAAWAVAQAVAPNSFGGNNTRA